MKPRISPPNRLAIWEYWQSQPNNIFGIVPEDRIFQCFACHEYEEGHHRVERAHIIARSSGGDFNPSNFLLLCADCHREAPMTSDPDILFSWVVNHERWGNRLVREAMTAIRKSNIQPEDVTPENLKGWNDLIEAIDLRFHPRSSRQEKMNVIAMMLAEYLRRVKRTATEPVLDRADEWI